MIPVDAEVLAFRFGAPGELTGPSSLEFGPDGGLWVRESTRFSVFSLDSAGAEYQRVVRSPNVGVVGVIGPFTFDPDGQLIAVGALFDGQANGEVRLRLNPDGRVDTLQLAAAERQSAGQATVPVDRGPFRGISYLHQPFGPRWVHTRIQDYLTPWATESLLYGVTADSLGVQRVARVRFTPAN